MQQAQDNLTIIEKTKTKKWATFPIRNFTLKIYSLLNWLAFLTLLIIVITINPASLNQFFNLTMTNDGTWVYYSLKIYCSLLFGFIVIANSLLLSIIFKAQWFAKINDNLFISFLISIFSLSFYLLIYLIVLTINKSKDFNYQQMWKHFKIRLGIKQRATKDYVLIALICGLTTTLAYIESIGLLPRMPFGGDMGLKYIPLILVSLLTSFIDGWITGAIAALISLLFTQGFILSPWSYLLDYFLPMTTPAIVALLPFKKHDKSIFAYINYFFHCFLVLTIIWIWQILSGYLFWVKFQPSDVWQGYTPLLYSIVYNFIHIFIFTYPILQLVIPTLYRSFGSYYLNRY